MTTSGTTAGTTMQVIIRESYGEAEHVLRLGQAGRPRSATAGRPASPLIRPRLSPPPASPHHCRITSATKVSRRPALLRVHGSVVHSPATCADSETT